MRCPHPAATTYRHLLRPRSQSQRPVLRSQTRQCHALDEEAVDLRLRTNQHFTLKQNPLRYEDLQDFISCFNPENRHDRQETERFKAFDYDDLIQRDKASLDIFWLRDEGLEDSDNLPDPDILAQDIAEDLGAALALFKSISEDLEAEAEAVS